MMLAIPVVSPFTPIATILLAHRITAPKSVEQKYAVTWIIIIVVPAAAKADVAERLAIVAIIICVIAAVRIATIIVFIIAVAGKAGADIVDTS